MKTKQLLSNEYVLLETRIHGSSLLKAFLRFLVWFLILVFIHGLLVRNRRYVLRNVGEPIGGEPWFRVQCGLNEHFDGFQTLVWIFIGIVAVVFVFRILRWYDLRYIITNRRILLQYGVFKRLRQVLVIDLAALAEGDVLLRKSLAQRCFGSGDIIVQAPNSFDPLTGRHVRAGYVVLKNMPQAGTIVEVFLGERNQSV